MTDLWPWPAVPMCASGGRSRPQKDQILLLCTVPLTGGFLPSAARPDVGASGQLAVPFSGRIRQAQLPQLLRGLSLHGADLSVRMALPRFHRVAGYGDGIMEQMGTERSMARRSSTAVRFLDSGAHRFGRRMGRSGIGRLERIRRPHGLSPGISHDRPGGIGRRIGSSPLEQGGTAGGCRGLLGLDPIGVTVTLHLYTKSLIMQTLSHSYTGDLLCHASPEECIGKSGDRRTPERSTWVACLRSVSHSLS